VRTWISFQKNSYQSFEIYLGAIFYIEDYPEIDESTAKIINEIKKEWIEKNIFQIIHYQRT
jgi:hypothetical protein